jgi:hypothetical protein
MIRHLLSVPRKLVTAPGYNQLELLLAPKSAPLPNLPMLWYLCL